MITYESTFGPSATRNTGLGSLPGTISGSTVNNQLYAVFAKIESGRYNLGYVILLWHSLSLPYNYFEII